MYTSSNPGYGSIKNFTLLFSDLLLLPLFVQQWPCNEKYQCCPWYLPQPHIIADIDKYITPFRGAFLVPLLLLIQL